MNFSWLCSSLFYNFSQIIEKCFESSTNYLNVENEQSFALDGLRVVLEAELRLEKLYPKEKPIFNRPRNPLALKPYLIERNMKIILEQKKNNKFIDEKSYIYEKGEDFEVGVVKINPKAILRPIKKSILRTYSPPSEKSSEDQIMINRNDHRVNSIRSSKTFQSKARSFSPTPKKILDANKDFDMNQTKEDMKFFITDEFLNFSVINENEFDTVIPKSSSPMNGYNLPFIYKMNETECSKILNKSKSEKEKLGQFTENKDFDKKNQNILPRLTEKLGRHTKKEIDLLEHQQLELIDQFNRYHNQKFF